MRQELLDKQSTYQVLIEDEKTPQDRLYYECISKMLDNVKSQLDKTFNQQKREQLLMHQRVIYKVLVQSLLKGVDSEQAPILN